MRAIDCAQSGFMQKIFENQGKNDILNIMKNLRMSLFNGRHPDFIDTETPQDKAKGGQKWQGRWNMNS